MLKINQHLPMREAKYSGTFIGTRFRSTKHATIFALAQRKHNEINRDVVKSPKSNRPCKSSKTAEGQRTQIW